MLERVPPHDMGAEEEVLACCLNDRYALSVAVERLKPEDFYRQAHGYVFEAMVNLFRKGDPVDFLTLGDELGSRLALVGGRGALTELGSSVPTAAHIERYAGILAEKSARREAIRIHQEALAALYDPEAKDPSTKALGDLMRVTADRGESRLYDVGDVLADHLQAVADKTKRRDEPDGSIDTPFYDLNQLVRIEPEDMVVFGARPSTGKTAIALQIMLHVAAGGKPVLFHSLEMGGRGIASRLYTLFTGISAFAQMGGFVSDSQLKEMERAYVDNAVLPYSLDFRPGLTVAQMAATIHRRMVERGPLGLVVIDHLGKVKPTNDRASKHAQLSQVSNDIKEMARKTKTPVLVLAQLNRDSDKENREPRMSDLRESGSIEEDADVIALLHRPERKAMTSPTKISVAKNRNGQCGDIDLLFEASKMRFQSVTYQAPPGG